MWVAGRLRLRQFIIGVMNWWFQGKTQMHKTVKAISLILAFFLIMAICIIGLNALSSGIQNDIASDGNSLVLDDSFSGKLYKVDGLRTENAQSLTFVMDLRKSTGQYSLLIDDLLFNHEIYLNGVLVSQNADSGGDNYDSGYAYKTFDINEYSDAGKEVTLQIKGAGVSGITLYLAQSSVMQEKTEIRVICNTVMLMLMILMTLTAVVWYTSNRNARFFLVFSLIGTVSAVKAVCTGELSVIAGALGFSAQNYAVWNSILSAANLFLPLAVMIYLLDIKVNRRLMSVFLAICVVLIAINGIISGPSLFYLVMTVNVYLTALALSLFGCVNKKRYCAIIFINNAVYSAFVTYAFLQNAGALRLGGLDFYIYPAYLGAEIYLLLFFTVFIKEFFREHKELEEKKKEYERVSLLRGIGHDLKLPLSVIKMNNQMLAKYDLKEDERKECAGLSSEAALEMEKMTDNINSFLNLRAVTDKAYLASLRDSFDKVVRRYSALSENSGYAFSASWEGPGATLPISPLHLERMLGNLLDNALKYSQKGSTLSFSCRVEPKKVILIVQDNGSGMEMQQLKKIFDPFYRADGSRTKEGLGLGLAVVKGIVDSLNGRIEVDSEPGRGTQITVILPTEYALSRK
ncbi:MAG: HAMP domain-containing histidine kinase [Clostridia bacterium]|nr:HAMP domain-containing histidine kinase [Clostridia bacterium]